VRELERRRDAGAAATVHRFNLVLSAVPTSVDGGDYNDFIDNINRTALEPRGLDGMEELSFGWYYEAQMRYFVRPNMAVHAGVGQLRMTTDREYLPFVGAAAQLHGEVLTVPVHVGGAYYLAPYNQGDFQARAYVGAGLLSHVYNRALFQQESANLPDVPRVAIRGEQDGPGYFVEAGAHMFFAVRYSVMLSALYRSSVIRNLQSPDGQPFLDPAGEEFELDLSGVGLRMGLAIGF
jgi:hypothetical protein